MRIVEAPTECYMACMLSPSSKQHDPVLQHNELILTMAEGKSSALKYVEPLELNHQQIIASCPTSRVLVTDPRV